MKQDGSQRLLLLRIAEQSQDVRTLKGINEWILSLARPSIGAMAPAAASAWVLRLTVPHLVSERPGFVASVLLMTASKLQ